MKHNTLKNIIVVSAISLFTSSSLMAEGKGKANWTEDAAQRYEKLAEKAEANKKPAQASIYKRMAQIKRDAGASEGPFNWDEYHELNGKLNKLRKQNKKGKPNEGFLNTARKYEKKAKWAKANGNHKKARIYKKMARIKRKAAAGRLDNWKEYDELQKQLHGQKKQAKRKNKKGGDSPAKGFLDTANKYQKKASEAMQNGNENNARVYTRLANIKREAARAVENGEDYDWTEYFKLQKELK